MKVSFSKDFGSKLLNFPKNDREKIFAFITHLETQGFEHLHGRNKAFDTVPKDDPNWSQKVAYAQKYQLWHYHIGIPTYETASNGDQVSEYILHYIRGQDEIKLVAMSYHPPFELPTENQLS